MQPLVQAHKYLHTDISNNYNAYDYTGIHNKSVFVVMIKGKSPNICTTTSLIYTYVTLCTKMDTWLVYCCNAAYSCKTLNERNLHPFETT